MTDSAPLILDACRLSVIIPSLNRRAFTERAVQSLLYQVDPPSLAMEIIVADDGSPDGTADHLESIFSDAVRQRKLRVERFERCGDLGMTRNRGASRARGTFLAFLDPPDYWKPGRLEWLEPLLSRQDLILGTQERTGESSDWIRAFLSANWAITSSAVIRRTLFDQAGGFPEGYSGVFLPRRLPGLEAYELWVKCLVLLNKTERRDRFLLVQEKFAVHEETPRLANAEILRRIQLVREAISLMHLAPELPRRYWVALARRLGETSRAVFKRK